MKLESKETEVRGSIGLRSSEASISEEDIDKLYKLIEAPYKRPISSIVREYTSNCFDAHQEAGVDDAVVVEFGKSQEIGYYISFNDVGVGMSEDRMMKVFVKLLKSTKEKTNDAIGAFGMGSKAGLSYNDFFFIETNFDGQYYKYIYRKGEKRPTLDLLLEEDTSERNGTKFIVPIKSEEDVVNFAQACETQLHYFENVVFDYKRLENFIGGWNYSRIKEALDNDFKLYKGKHFTIRINKNNPNPTKNQLHILNGPVYYPIDFNNITGITDYSNLLIGLNFEIGELDVIQTREDVRYNEKTVGIIKERLNDAVEELQELYGTEDIIETKTYNEYVVKSQDATSRMLRLGSGEYEVRLTHYQAFKKKRVVLAPFYNIAPNYTLPVNLKVHIFERFQIYKSMTCTSFPTVRATKVEYNSYTTFSSGLHSQNTMQNIILNTKEQGLDLPKMVVTTDRGDHSVKLNKQIAFKDKEQEFNYTIPVFHLRQDPALERKDNNEIAWYHSVLNLFGLQEKEQDAIVQLYRKMSNKYVENIMKQPSVVNYDKLKLDEKWYSDFAARHRKKAADRDTSLVNIRVRSSSAWLTYKRTMHDLANIDDRYTVFIAPNDDKELLTTIGNESEYYPNSLFSNEGTHKRKIQLITLAPTNYEKLVKLVEDKDNYHTMEDYINNKDNIKFKYLADLYVYHKIKGTGLLDLINNAKEMKSPVRQAISEEFNTLTLELHKYVSSIEYHYSGWSKEKEARAITTEIEALEDFVEIKKYFILQKLNRYENYYPYFNHFFRLFLDATGFQNYRHRDSDLLISRHSNTKNDIDYIASTLVLTKYNRLGIVRPEVYEPVDDIEYNALVEAVQTYDEAGKMIDLDYILACVRIKKYEINKLK